MVLSRRSRSRFYIFILFIFSYGYFNHDDGGWNENARLCTLQSILERNSLDIDGCRNVTFDTVKVNGHTYGDKAPGTVVLGILPLKAYAVIRSAFESNRDSQWKIAPIAFLLIMAMAYFPVKDLSRARAVAVTILSLLPGILIVLVYNDLISGKPWFLAYQAHLSGLHGGMSYASRNYGKFGSESANIQQLLLIGIQTYLK